MRKNWTTFQTVKKSSLKIPEFIFRKTIAHKHAEKQLNVDDFHRSIMTVRSTLSSNKLSWIIMDSYLWDVLGVRNETVNLLDSLDTFFLRRNKNGVG